MSIIETTAMARQRAEISPAECVRQLRITCGNSDTIDKADAVMPRMVINVTSIEAAAQACRLPCPSAGGGSGMRRSRHFLIERLVAGDDDG